MTFIISFHIFVKNILNNGKITEKMKGRENIIGKGFDARPENINRNGRPKGVKNRSTLIRKWIETKIKDKNPITNKKENTTLENHIIIALIHRAMKGDVNAFKEIMDSVYGKNPDINDINFNKITGLTFKEEPEINDLH